MEKNTKKNVYITESLHWTLTQHCKSTILQLKKKKEMHSLFSQDAPKKSHLGKQGDPPTKMNPPPSQLPSPLLALCFFPLPVNQYLAYCIFVYFIIVGSLPAECKLHGKSNIF